MTTSTLLLGLAIACIACAVVSAVMIAATLDRKGLKTPFPLLGVLTLRNVNRYRDITRSETGKTGALFYSYVVPVNAALLLVTAALVVWVTR